MLKWSRQVTMVARTQAGAEGRCWSGAKHLAGWGGGLYCHRVVGIGL